MTRVKSLLALFLKLAELLLELPGIPLFGTPHQGVLCGGGKGRDAEVQE